MYITFVVIGCKGTKYISYMQIFLHKNWFPYTISCILLYRWCNIGVLMTHSGVISKQYRCIVGRILDNTRYHHVTITFALRNVTVLSRSSKLEIIIKTRVFHFTNNADFFVTFVTHLLTAWFTMCLHVTNRCYTLLHLLHFRRKCVTKCKKNVTNRHFFVTLYIIDL